MAQAVAKKSIARKSAATKAPSKRAAAKAPSAEAPKPEPSKAKPSQTLPVAKKPSKSTEAKPAQSKTQAPKRIEPKPVPRAALIRESINLPEADYALIKMLKARVKQAGGGSVKKRDILRAALRALHDSGAAELLRILKGLPPISKKSSGAKS